MSNGKRVTKSDVVILSIKPKRPEFCPDKKYVSVTTALQEWDKLDAYYRGQILKLKTNVKTESKNEEKLATFSPKNQKSTSVCIRRLSASSGHELTDLFGEDVLVENDCHGSDDENRSPLNPRSKSRNGKKSEKRKSGHKTHKSNNDNGDNYLSVPRDNFVIEFAIVEKKRTPIHHPDPPGYISPIKVEPYKPPQRAIGFNGVHIQKILYHKSDGTALQNSPPPKTSVSTPDKPPTTELTSPPLLLHLGDERKGCENFKNGKQNNVSPSNKTATSQTMKRKMDQTVGNGELVQDGNLMKKQLMDKTSHEHKIPTMTSPIKANGSPLPLVGTSKSYMGVSITDKIIKKANELSPELRKRERRRQLESEKRKAYAFQKTVEQSIMDSVDVSIKAMEMMCNTPMLSPIRSP